MRVLTENELRALTRVFGKGRRHRLVGIDPETCKALDRYLRRRGSTEGPLWAGLKGPMTTSGIRQMIWRRSEGAGIGRVHPHTFRHTHAHRWLLLAVVRSGS